MWLTTPSIAPSPLAEEKLVSALATGRATLLDASIKRIAEMCPYNGLTAEDFTKVSQNSSKSGHDLAINLIL